MRNLSMKKISLIVSIIVFTILLVAVIIILNFTKGDVRVDVLKEKTTVGLLLSCEKDDDGWCESHYSALAGLSEELNLEIICMENVKPGKNCNEIVDSLINDDGCTLIIGALFSCEPYLSDAAKEFPETHFIQVGGNVSGYNLYSFTGRMYQFRYLSGIVAGASTKTNEIGYVAPEPVPEVVRDINAFALGVRRVNPGATVHVRYCDSWSDDAAAEKAAEKLIAGNNIDIMTTHTDSLAPLKAAEKRGMWTIGCNADNSAEFPSSFLTGCVWNWKNVYSELILDQIRGKFSGKSEMLGIESGIMSLVDPAKTGHAPGGYEAELNKMKKSFENHSFDVFYGPVKDCDGKIRIAEGEAMSDSYMLENFDWYVEGVEVE